LVELNQRGVAKNFGYVLIDAHLFLTS